VSSMNVVEFVTVEYFYVVIWWLQVCESSS